MREMPHSWKLHLTAFWLAFICVCLVALVVGWNATSVVTDEPTSYLLYETAFLGLLVVLGAFLVLASHRIGRIDNRMGEIENEALVWAAEKGWKKSIWGEELKDWIEERVERGNEEIALDNEGSGKELLLLLEEHSLLSDSRRGAWKKLLGPVLQLLFLTAISSAAVPSSYWFLQAYQNMNTMSAIVVIGGSVITVPYALSSLLFLLPKMVGHKGPR